MLTALGLAAGTPPRGVMKPYMYATARRLVRSPLTSTPWAAAATAAGLGSTFTPRAGPLTVLRGEGLVRRAPEPAGMLLGGQGTLHHRFFGSASAGTTVLVKIGSGEVSTFAPAADAPLEKMDRMALLKALAMDKGFCVKLSNVALDDCKVFLLRCAGNKPTAVEEKAAIELEAGDTISKALKAGQPVDAKLLVCVRLPAAPPAAGEVYAPGARWEGGTGSGAGHVSQWVTAAQQLGLSTPAAVEAALPFDKELGIPESVWADMGPQAQSAAVVAGAQRAKLSSVELLLQLGDTLEVKQAKKLSVTVLHQRAGNVSVGLFKLPKLDDAVMSPPKTYEALTAQSHEILLLPQRLELAADFVTAVRAGARGSGVLLSGPSGVGKSGVGLLSYVLCAARRLPVVYLGGTKSWVQAAHLGNGDAYLLTRLWWQNADLIAASEPLRRVFAAALRDEAGAFTPHTMEMLRVAVAQHHLGMGLIVDEVQHITEAVSNGAAAPPDSPAGVAGTYFRLNWHDWINDNHVFVRMSIASSHGERDYELPSGEAHRLRVVEPLSDVQRSALQTHPESPAFINDAQARRNIVFFSGNILRTLMQTVHGLPAKPAARKVELQHRLAKVYVAMQEDCGRWLASLPEAGRKRAVEVSMNLLSGKLPWTSVKRLDDAGIVYRTAQSDRVRPVSVAASSAYLTTVASYFLDTAAPLSSIADGRRRGFAMQDQMLARLATASVTVFGKLLDGTEGGEIHLHSCFVVPFGKLDEVVPREAPVLYRPWPLTYPFDGILMPAADDKEGTIIVLEFSTTDPRGFFRVEKVLRYMLPNGVISDLARRFPALRRFVLLVYDKELQKSTLGRSADALSRGEPPWAAPALTPGGAPAAAGPVMEVRVLDRESLHVLGGLML